MKSIVLIGLGGAGLAFVHQFLQTDTKDISLTVVDGNLHSAYSKTWCYWAGEEELRAIRNDMEWTSMTVGAAGAKIDKPLTGLTYRCVQGSTYHSQVWKGIQSDDRITVVRDVVTAIRYEETSQRVSIHTEKSGPLTADFCFTSAPGNRQGWEPSFYQQFAGGWVTFDKPVFDATSLTLMDFNITQHDGSVHFAYILPRNAREALIEITAFTPRKYTGDHYNRIFRDYLHRIAAANGSAWEVTLPEEGIIPMDTRPYERQLNPRTFTLGTVSGMVKPSTGYAFYRMQDQAAYYLKQLRMDTTVLPYPETHPRFRFYDDLLLDILKHEPHATLSILHQLFKHTKGDRVLEFLRENTTLLQEAMLFATLPKTPFLKALWRYVFH